MLRLSVQKQQQPTVSKHLALVQERVIAADAPTLIVIRWADLLALAEGVRLEFIPLFLGSLEGSAAALRHACQGSLLPASIKQSWLKNGKLSFHCARLHPEATGAVLRSAI